MSLFTDPEPGTVSLRTPQQLVSKVIEVAVWAPSIHNTQPWWFGTRNTVDGPVISLHADLDRKLNITDPGGREMLISCGAALATMRLAIQRHGYEPKIKLLEDPDRPALLADVCFGERREVTEEIRRLYGQIHKRRSHRGLFRDTPVNAHIQSALHHQALHEGARLQVVTEPAKSVVAALTMAAEKTFQTDPAYLRETARWAPAPGSLRMDGVHHTAYPNQTALGEPHFPTRDFARGQGWGALESEPGPAGGVTGVVVLLTTKGDGRTDWLTAGQALQRVLLRASADWVSAAFHTQALEIPELRDYIRTRFCSAAYPQVLLRLGVTDSDHKTVRRPAPQVTSKEP